MNMSDSKIGYSEALLRGKKIKVGDMLFDREDESFKRLTAIAGVELAFVESDFGKVEMIPWIRLQKVDDEDENLFLKNKMDEMELERRFVW